MTFIQTNHPRPVFSGGKSSYNRGVTIRAHLPRKPGWGAIGGRLPVANLIMSRSFEFDAVIFDMDGVITDTASVHAAAWKQAFDAYLLGRARALGQPFRGFTADDYLSYVDGRPRYKGVQAFLNSRGITLEQGASTDAPGRDTVCGLGNQKNNLFNELLEGGIKTFNSSIALVQDLRRNGVKVGLATSSRNGTAILRITRTEALFDTVVDGLVSERLGLKGKPEPDIFTAAADNLRVPYDRAVVVEDASTGVRAGAAGGFALVVGVARADNAEELRAHGADVVVEDLAEAGIDLIDRWVQSKRRGAAERTSGIPDPKGRP